VGSATENFAKLKEQVDQAAKAVAAAASEDERAVQAKVDDARKNADGRAAELRAKAQDASDDAADHWHKIRTDWDQHVARSRKRVDEALAQLDVSAAVQDMEWAENDAIDAIDFASAAITEAEYAVLDAVRARQNAEALAGASA
jgi:hypothetical protein